jgi:hypothetical protein
MTDRYLDRDIELISAYIDSRLSPAENTKVKARLQSDAKFNQLLQDLTYTRRLLQALPKKRAPRNFTLSAEYARAPRKMLWLQPAMSFVSVAAAVTLVVLFASTYLLGGTQNAATEAPVPMAAESRGMDDSSMSAPPVIINWNPQFGMGGGGGDEPYAGGYGGGGAGGPGWDLSAPVVSSEPAAPEEMPAEPTPTQGLATEIEEAPAAALTAPGAEEFAAKSADGSDLSTMILGLPAEELQGEIITTSVETGRDGRGTGKPFNKNLVMILSAIVAALAGAAAIFLRRR